MATSRAAFAIQRQMSQSLQALLALRKERPPTRPTESTPVSRGPGCC